MDATQINSVIDKIAEKLAVPAERIVDALAMQGGVYFTTTLIMAGVIFIILIAGLIARTGKFGDVGEELLAPVFLIIGIAGLLIILIALWNTLPDYLVWRESPEAYAIIKAVEKLR